MVFSYYRLDTQRVARALSENFLLARIWNMPVDYKATNDSCHELHESVQEGIMHQGYEVYSKVKKSVQYAWYGTVGDGSSAYGELLIKPLDSTYGKENLPPPFFIDITRGLSEWEGPLGRDPIR